ncbi:alanine--tRNA ligase, partial [Candidatus Kaiserbacteria bacterium]|nr:alanine--tRNA ligase [Candidatus Kaiserbacteria bacterium]
SGMQPMLPYFLGEPHPEGTRITDSQKSFRAEDIEEVGDNRHTTFFEMLGNWSLGDYFKKDQLTWMFEFLTDEIGLDPQNLYVTVFAGDEKYDMPRDEESVATWKALFASKGIDATDIVLDTEEHAAQVGMQGGRIFYYGVRKNWWSRAGVPDKMPTGEPGGPDSEMFYDFGTPHDETFGTHCHPNCDCGRFMEIGNNVFMQYIKREDGFADLPKRNVDFGGGLERITAATNHDPDVFKIDVFAEIIDLLETFSGKQYADPLYQRSFRIVADHMRAAVFMLADGVRPSNTERGYILRRLIRRASQHAQKIGVQNDKREESMLNRCAVIIIEKYKAAYSELATEEAYQEITKEIWKEEVQFGHALERGLKVLEVRVAEEIKVNEGVRGEIEPKLEKNLPIIRQFNEGEPIPRHEPISGKTLFELFTTFGFPAEMSLEVFDSMRQQHGLEALPHERRSRILKEFQSLMEQHQELSRAGSEQKFKGGLADHSEATVRLHTTHHILLKALQMVLGEHVKQRGSNITGERLRIDFSHDAKMTDEQKREVERIVNEVIQQHLPMTRSTMPKDEAEHLGAQHEFGAKYPDIVSVYSLGPLGATLEDPQFDQAFSIEFCGGPHVQNTSEIAQAGTFKITKEEAVASGIRRIKAVLVL